MIYIGIMRFNHHQYFIHIMNTLKKIYKVIAVPLFQDNYSYVVQGTAKNKLVLVDPANPTVVLSFLKSNFPQHQVSHVLYTHKHWDHAGDSLSLYNQLKSSNPNVKVVIGEHDRNFVEGSNYSLGIDQDISIGSSKVKTLHVPCHTKGHTIYSFLPLQQQPQQTSPIIEDAVTIEGKKIRAFESQSCTFTGDTLFIGGIGRFFQGNAAQMTSNIRKIYDKISLSSHIYCGHQYTLANLRWAAQVEKQNQQISTLLATLEAQYSLGKEICTIPSTLLQQKQINLFVRTVTGTPLLNLTKQDAAELMRVLREMKNKNMIQFGNVGL